MERLGREKKTRSDRDDKGPKLIDFWIPFAEGKRRPHPGKDEDGKTVMYSDEKERQNEVLIRVRYSNACVQKFGKFVRFPDYPLELSVMAYFPIGPGKEGKHFWYTGKADGDNILKLIADALNGYAFKDDAQIAKWYIVKIRSYDFDKPCCLVTIHRLNKVERMPKEEEPR